MKYLLFILTLAALATGCSKSDCIQCSREVRAASQPNPAVIDYSVVYVDFCGRQADTAMAMDITTYPYFVSEHNLVAYTCFYK